MERDPAESDDSDSSEREEGEETEDEIEEEEEDLICPVCVKIFTNERNKELHMKSKKHKIMLALYLEEQSLLNQESDAGSEPGEDIGGSLCSGF